MATPPDAVKQQSTKVPAAKDLVERKCESKEVVKMEKNQPEKKFRAMPVSATIWANEGKNKNGEAVSFKTISLDRNYKDKDGNWKSTNSFRVNDLPKAMLVLNKAYEYLIIKDTTNSSDEEEIF